MPRALQKHSYSLLNIKNSSIVYTPAPAAIMATLTSPGGKISKADIGSVARPYRSAQGRL